MTDTPEAASATRRIWTKLAPYAAPACVLLAFFIPFLRFHEYSLLEPESLILIAGAVVVGVGIGALGQLRPNTAAPLLVAFTLLVYLFMRHEVTTFLVKTAIWIGDYFANAVVVLVLLFVAIFLVIAPVCVLLRRHLDTIVVAVFGTMVVTSLVLPVETGGKPVEVGSLPKDLKDLPPVVHIILDEHIAPAGIPPGLPESEAARQAIASTFRDFQLYTHAYSRFAETKYALTSLMNRDWGADVMDILDGGGYVFTPRRNAWFDRLKADGYAIKVYQSSWYDMCRGSEVVDACYTYSFHSPNAIQRTDLTTSQRLRALLKDIVFGAQALQLEPLVSLEALQRFRDDIAETPRGVAYVIHLVIPHYGYLFDSECRLLDPSQWHRTGYGADALYSTEEREDLYRRYLRQIVCAERQVDELLDELKAIGVYDDATIIVHGDHGSRLARRPYITNVPEELDTRDKIDLYAALLAVKAPGVAPGTNDEPVALQHVFADRFLGGDLPSSPGPGAVFMNIGKDKGFDQLSFAWPDALAPEVNTILGELRR